MPLYLWRPHGFAVYFDRYAHRPLSKKETADSPAVYSQLCFSGLVHTQLNFEALTFVHLFLPFSFLVKPGFHMISRVCDRSATRSPRHDRRSACVTYQTYQNICPWCLLRSATNGLGDRKSWIQFYFPDHSDRVLQTAADAEDRCFHMSTTWRRPIADHVADCVAERPSYGNYSCKFYGWCALCSVIVIIAFLLKTFVINL